MDNESVVAKLRRQTSPTMLFSDIDGTLFSPNLNLLTAPLYNIQTRSYLKKQSIPFVTVTGRSFWTRTDQAHLTLLGMPQADTVITANGTAIYYRQKEKYVSDFAWQGIMQSTKVTNTQGQTTTWNKQEITETIANYLGSNHRDFRFGQGNTYLIRIRFNTYPVAVIKQIQKDVLTLFPKGIRIVPTEKLLWKNTLEIFSGELLITPATGGKDKAVAYVLKNLATEIQKPIHAFLFGDASVDVPMLTMKHDEKYYTLSQFGIHPTPLANAVLKEKMQTNTHLKILSGDGPKEILWTLRPELRKQDNKLSPAQNNKARQSIRKFEWVLDKMVDKNMSPNEISFLGLTKLSEGLKNLSQKSLVQKTKGWYQYGFGNLTDILDGIRARNSDKKEENGQLVDGFADRAKEFMQLFHRAKKRMDLQTFLASLSCCLPSIARAQVEISGQTVAERDAKGGSMVDRTKRLFLSLLFDSFGMPDQSLKKDLEIYETNLATFHHRFSFAKKIDLQKLQIDKLSEFQKKALERFLVYVDVLQQENKIIKKYLSKHPELLKEYEKQSNKLAKEYLELSISKLRKKFEIKDYKLEVKKYINN